MAPITVAVNRAPVLTLWAAVVARRLGFDEYEALSLGKALAGLNAQAKGRRLGVFKPHEEKARQARQLSPFRGVRSAGPRGRRSAARAAAPTGRRGPLRRP
jgi:hypothetical protein